VILQPTTNSADFFQVKKADGTSFVYVDTANQKVKFGTMDPSETELEVNGPILIYSDSAELKLQDTSGDHFKVKNWNGQFVVYNETDERIDMEIDDDGNMGVGKADADEKLDVNGNIKASGSVQLGAKETSNPAAGMLAWDSGHVKVYDGSTWQTIW
jgi:hypothetical protein